MNGTSTKNSYNIHTDGKTLIPALLIAMTKGDAAAVPLVLARLSLGSFEGTSKPITVTPPM